MGWRSGKPANQRALDAEANTHTLSLSACSPRASTTAADKKTHQSLKRDDGRQPKGYLAVQQSTVGGGGKAMLKPVASRPAVHRVLMSDSMWRQPVAPGASKVEREASGPIHLAAV